MIEVDETGKPVEPNRPDGCFGAMLGGALGGVAGLVLPPVYYQLTNPRILQDGQWGIVYSLSLPAGAIFGAVLGAILIAARNKNI